MFKGIIIAAALIAAPSENYYSWVSPEIADAIIAEATAGNYHEYLDYNGDGALTMADAVCVARKYQQNVELGNEITVAEADVIDVLTENYTDVIEWEITRINGEETAVRMFTADDITEAEIRVEMPSKTEYITIEANPFTELISVKEVEI